MTSFGSKLFDIFKNLKSDAMPKPPRAGKASKITIDDVTEEDWTYNENVNTSNEQEDIPDEPETLPKHKQQKTKENYNAKTESDNPVPNNSVNVQATGNVWIVAGSTKVHIGNRYDIRTTNLEQQNSKNTKEKIKKTKDIENVLTAPTKVSHKYIDYVAKNLGFDWQQFFRKLNYSQNSIQTYIIDAGPSGVKEARYQLLLDWSRNDKMGTLGRLASLLWEAGEREVVQGLALIYKEHKDTK